jgi:hypothetical protein
LNVTNEHFNHLVILDGNKKVFSFSKQMHK